MKFILIDRILELDPPGRIVTCKGLTLAEEYLADHFPTFPVMPGVLMVEAAVQSAAWLVRASTDFAKSVILLSEVRNVTYKSFVSPGKVLRLEISARKIDEAASEFDCRGACDGREMVKARLRLRHFNLSDENPMMADVDARLTEHARRQFELLGGAALVQSAATG
ncbi:MAG: beta-hydroxyacyl-ACP dehydratase [Phycisphaerae bacterium]|nr:beta-hydroxyacyl-ACP dehydratase [Phycisphaerae bacterium]